jgi:protein-disulfide isomerase
MQKLNSSLYVPVLVVLLVAASFFVGRLSAQVAEMGGGSKNTKAVPTIADTTGSPIAVDALKAMAKSFGLDEGKFNKCLDDGVMTERVKNETKEGQDRGVSGTPSFFINGLLVVGSLPQADFEKVIEAELKNGGGLAEAEKIAGEKITRAKIEYGKGYVKGGKNAKIKIMEYTDFECPFCNKSFPTIEALLTKYGENISLEYRSYPLPFHADAQKAAEAALCAGEQGKFWEMHDQMFKAMAGI